MRSSLISASSSACSSRNDSSALRTRARRSAASSGEPSPFGGGGAASGSGFLIDADGSIVTNQHVVDGASDLRIRFGADGEPVRATFTFDRDERRPGAAVEAKRAALAPGGGAQAIQGGAAALLGFVQVQVHGGDAVREGVVPARHQPRHLFAPLQQHGGGLRHARGEAARLRQHLQRLLEQHLRVELPLREHLPLLHARDALRAADLPLGLGAQGEFCVEAADGGQVEPLEHGVQVARADGGAHEATSAAMRTTYSAP
ncbi:MAG: serine protease [Actinobacteria bacterium]|nr:serine protease [Actinomycetota bacterium]